MMVAGPKAQAHDLYAALVKQARQPFLYRELGIPDTLDGRFDAVVLHLFLLTRRLKQRHDARFVALVRLLQETFITDMDRSLREMGVGDMGVGRRVKQMAGAMQGRLRAYAAAEDTAALAEALVRNVWRGKADPHAPALAEYIQTAGVALAAQDDAVITSGRFGFYASEGSKPASAGSA